MSKVKIPVGHGKTRIGSVWIDGGSDGDHWIISPTKDGGIVITHIPPEPPVDRELRTVASVLIAPGTVSLQQISAHFKSPASSGTEVMAAIAMLGKE